MGPCREQSKSVKLPWRGHGGSGSANRPGAMVVALQLGYWLGKRPWGSRHSLLPEVSATGPRFHA